MGSKPKAGSDRDWFRKHPTLEQVEGRVLLSTIALPGFVAATSVERELLITANNASVSTNYLTSRTTEEAASHHRAEDGDVHRSRKSATEVMVSPASGVKGGAVALEATLTSDGSALAGRAVSFQVNGRRSGKASTNVQGMATIPSAKLNGFPAGKYPAGVVVTFAGNASLNRSTGKGELTVSRFATSLSVSGSSVIIAFGNGHDFANSGFDLEALLTSNGTPLPGQAISFAINGQVVGSANTDSQGVAQLNVSFAGFPGTVTASFAGGITYQPNNASGGIEYGTL
jgi:hypothetical protein